KSPNKPEPHSWLGAALNNHASILREQGKLDEARQLLVRAITHQRAALNVTPQHPTYRQFLRNHYVSLAHVLVLLRAHAAATKTIDESSERFPGDYAAARLLARCVSLAENDEKLKDERRLQLADAYGQRAVEILREAARRGWLGAQHMKKAPDLDPLRRREDF